MAQGTELSHRLEVALTVADVAANPERIRGGNLQATSTIR
jgi:hypothetical protein